MVKIFVLRMVILVMWMERFGVVCIRRIVTVEMMIVERRKMTFLIYNN
jgi:hypothetical protein